MSKPKLLAFDDTGYASPYEPLFQVVVPDEDHTMLHNIKSADCILFTGGADIHPRLYGDRLLAGTCCHEERDRVEEVIFRIAMNEKKPILGICRGAQLACAMAGGRLVQDVTGHGMWHDMITSEGTVLQTSSLHHQMMMPNLTKHRLLAWSEKRSDHYHCGMDAKANPNYDSIVNLYQPYMDEKEPEVVFFEDIRALGIQGHPEMMSEHGHKESLDWFREQIKTYLIN